MSFAATREPGPHSARIVSATAVLIVAALAPPRARAEVVTGPCATVMDPDNAPSTDPRVEHLTVDGVHVNVLVPPRYQDGHRRYPVVYLFHGAFGDEDSFSTQTDLLAFTAALPEDEQAIAVMPDGGHLPSGSDWADGTHHQETFVIDRLLPYIDARYRTRGDGAFRAAAGFSGGGLDTMVFAARHPELFAAAGSFSGFVDPYSPAGFQVTQLLAEQDDDLCGANDDWMGVWGDPVAHPMGWMAHDPTDLAPSLGDVSLYISTGNGQVCPGDPTPDPFLVFAETVVHDMSVSLVQALRSAGLDPTTSFRDCGVHQFSNVNLDLPRFWAQMLAAFGRRAPRRFDWRTGDAVASAWGWQFTADATRAPEMLDVRGASVRGVTLTGSGHEAVTTGPLFEPGEWVGISGADTSGRRIRADRAGRLSFAVDLGPAHTLEEGTDPELALASTDPSYFVTSQVRFARCDPDDAR
jgi:S-formylglutathione hydrolase FrmB